MIFIKKYDTIMPKCKRVCVVSMRITKKILAVALALVSTFTAVSAEPANKENLLGVPINVENNKKLKSKMKSLGEILTVGTVTGFTAVCFYRFYESVIFFERGENLFDIVLYCYSIPGIRKSIEKFEGSSEDELSAKKFFTSLFEVLDSGNEGYINKNNELIMKHFKIYAICHSLEKTIRGILKCENLEKVIADAVKEYVHSIELNSQFFHPIDFCTVNMDTFKDTLSIYLGINLFNIYALNKDFIRCVSKEGGSASYKLKSIILHSSCGRMPEVWTKIGNHKWIEGAFVKCRHGDIWLLDHTNRRCNGGRSMHLIYERVS